MAQAGLFLDQDQFNCSVCLDVLRNPVTIPCGHSYCSVCIKGYWDQDDFLGVYCCPQCRQSFNPRPVLGRNTMLAEVVDKFKKTGLQAVPPPQSYAGPEDVECDVCTGRKNRAVKSCLVCLASYCDTHLLPHYESAPFKKHKLVQASKKLQETICPQHDKLLEVYCRTDQRCICYLCMTADHKGHDTVLVDAEIQQKQSQLGELRRRSQQRIQEREKDVEELRQAISSLTRSARSALEDTERVFTELIRSMELKRFEVRELIKAQEKTAVSQAEGLLAKLEQEMSEMRRRDAELEQLSHTEDHIFFLQSCQSLSSSPVIGGLPAVTFDPNFTFNMVMSSVADFRGLLEEVCQGSFISIYEKVREVSIVESPEPSSCFQTDPTQQTAFVAPPPALAAVEQTPSGGGLNPFLSPGAAVPTFGGFAFSPFGSKLSSSSGSRQRMMQRKSHPRRKL
ncbi:tripartite motif-containing protein 29 [Salmo trutta]|uniref:FinTRIM family, member 67 n=1 Tax=Salmo trutta TaxID=8032 RepID=A0A674B8D4_SALTR|nr:tripartite motif-containing protein 29-like [Salmo trutta]